MADISPDFRTRMKRVKGLGSAKHGVEHWWLERVTALALVPLSIWFVYSLMSALLLPNAISVAEWFISPVNAIATALFLVISFIHSKLGIQVVVEDYVKCPAKKYGLLLINTFLCYGLAGMSLLAVLKLHFLDMTSSL